MNDHHPWEQGIQNPAYRNLRPLSYIPSPTMLARQSQQRSKRSNLLIQVCTIFALALPSIAHAGSLTILGTPKLKILQTINGVSLSGTYSIVNRGDEIATDVLPEITIGGWIYQGEPQRIEPNQLKNWQLDERIPLDELKCSRSNDCGGLDLPLTGRFPIRVRRLYKDLNGAPFSAIEMGNVTIGVPLTAQKEETIKVRAWTKKQDPDVEIFVEISNDSDVERAIGVSLQVPREFPLKEGSKQVKVAPHSRQNVKFTSTIEKLTNGSRYFLFPVIQWDQDGQRNSAYTSVFVEVLHARSSKVYVVVGGLVILSMTALLLFGTRARDKQVLRK